MSDWQVGDMAVCVDDSPCRCFDCRGLLPVLYRRGGISRVIGITGVNDTTGLPMLLLDGLPVSYRNHAPGYHSVRFRKIRPDEHEACEPEFVTLLKRSKRTVAA